MDLPNDAVLADRYRIVARRGRGGMAVVYAAHDEVLDRRVAVKVLAEHLLDDPRAVDRFEREARAAARLNHPNVVGVHDAASDGDTHFLVMELIAGTTLADRLRADGPLEVDATLDLADQVGAALAAAHDAGMVHRDVKPSNILLTEDGTVKVADFGIARAVASAATQTAVVMGSVPYVAPEQLDGSSGADPRSDLYALGCVLHECLTGRPPFVADTSAAVLGQHLHLTPAAVSERRDVPPGVDALVAGLLAKSPDDRPPSAEAFRRQVARVRAGGMPDDPLGRGDHRGPGAGAAGAAAAGVAAAGAAAGAAARRDRVDDQAATEAMDPTEAGATERIDPAATPTEVIDDGGRTAVLPGAAAAGAAGAGAAGATTRDGPAGAPPPGEAADDRNGGRGWWIAATVLALLAAGIWAWTTWFGGDEPTPAPTPSVTAPATSEPDDAPTDAPTTEPATTEPAEPAPTTAPEPTTAPPTTPPTTAPPTTPPTTPPPTATPGSSPTAAAITNVRTLLSDGVDRGQLSDDGADAIGARLTAVSTRLSTDDDDRVAKAREEVAAVRQEVDAQVASGDANRGLANQLQAELDDLDATLA